MPRMQTLGLTDDARSESRLKTLFWPTIQSGADVDYLGAQGFWVCTIIGAITFITLLATGSPLMAASMLLFFHFGGVGVRERDLFAATICAGVLRARLSHVADLYASRRAWRNCCSPDHSCAAALKSPGYLDRVEMGAEL